MIGVLGMADVLRQKGLEAKDQELVETIYRSGEALLEILNDILDFSKIEAGQLNLAPAPVDLVRLVEDVTRLMGITAHNKGLSIKLEVSSEAPIVMGDPGRIRQVLLNLVGNAVKFTDKGSVTVSLVTAIQTTEEVCDCLLVVKDTGIGISEAAQERIFDSFDQGDSSSTWNYGGTGLGLAIVKELVELMGGEITVRSLLGKGSTFTVRLALKTSSQTETAFDYRPTEKTHDVVLKDVVAPHSHSLANGSARVLLAEDNPTTQNLLSILLQQMGIEFSIVDNGQDALDRATQQSFDLIFMDCQMPQMDGFEATSQLRSRGIETPVIALTAYARAEDEQLCLDAGMSDFLSKPFRQSDLRDILERWLGENALPVDPPVPGSVS